MGNGQSLNGRDWVALIEAMASAVAANQDQLTALDSKVGDGDHGVNMTMASGAAATAVRQLPDPTPADVLKATGTAVMNTMGGASGVIFGSFFRGGGRAVKGKEALTLPDLAAAMRAGLVEVQQRGKARAGDKTMVDALLPAVEALETAVAQNSPLAEALAHAAGQANEGAKTTQNQVAQFGRAKFLGERSLGHQDAGATSMAIMLSAWATTIGEGV